MSKISFILTILLAFGIVLLFSKHTDADLKDTETVPENTFTAMTIDFSTTDTATFTDKSALFTIAGMQKGGFAVQSLRIKNETAFPLAYKVTAQKTGGDDAACQALNLVILEDLLLVSDESLLGVNLERTLETGAVDPLILLLELAEDAPANQSCLFSLTFSTKETETEISSLFFDEEVIQNSISTGSW